MSQLIVREVPMKLFRLYNDKEDLGEFKGQTQSQAILAYYRQSGYSREQVWLDEYDEFVFECHDTKKILTQKSIRAELIRKRL